MTDEHYVFLVMYIQSDYSDVVTRVFKTQESAKRFINLGTEDFKRNSHVKKWKVYD